MELLNMIFLYLILRNHILLTVGDGLVAQIPSLLLAMATATIVTRISSDKDDLAGQISTQMGWSKAWCQFRQSYCYLV